MTVGEPWFWWHLEMVKTEISKRTKKPIIHNSTISRRLIHLKFVVKKLRATRFSKKQFKIGVIRFYITDRGTAAVAPWVQRGFNVGSTWADCPHDTASIQQKRLKTPKARKPRGKIEKVVAPSFSAGFFQQNNFLSRRIQNRPPISTNKPLCALLHFF